MDVASWLKERRGGGSGHALPEPLITSLAKLYDEGEWAEEDVTAAADDFETHKTIWSAIFDMASDYFGLSALYAAVNPVAVNARCEYRAVNALCCG